MKISRKLKPPQRVLHIVENLDRGAVENWLVRMLRHARACDVNVDWTFYCTLEHPGALENQAHELGARVIHSPAPMASMLRFLWALRSNIVEGKYEILHCHHDLVSAVYIAASAGLSIRRVLVHAHNPDEHLPTASTLKKALLREPMRRICLSADWVVGISNHTLDTMLGGRARRPGRDVVHYYGVDPSPFLRATGDRAAFRRALGLTEDALILLFGGRITPEKNPVFAVDVLAALRNREPRCVGVFAGAGSLEGAVAERAGALGVAEHLRMIGWRADLPEVMAACDWFILPHPEEPLEGFGLAVVEAQLAGLRMLLSRGVPDDSLLPTAVFRRLPLAELPEAWAAAALMLLDERGPSREATLAALADSPMDMGRAFASLMELHE